MTMLLFVLVALVFAQDPAQGWLGYAKGTSPNGEGIITYIEAKWHVPNKPKHWGGFFSPWFGIESSDNLNLMQPVNPWSGFGWSIYNEYFQWEPEHNINSRKIDVKEGSLIFGSLTFNPKNQTYTVYHSDLTTKRSVTSEFNVQRTSSGYKKMTIAYFVMEKVNRCDQYPPDGIVTFFDIKVEYDGKVVDPLWTTSYVEDVCNNRAKILNKTAISITWDP